MSIFVSASALISITRVYNNTCARLRPLVTFRLTRGFGYHGQTQLNLHDTPLRCMCAQEAKHFVASPDQNTLGQVTAASTTLGLDLIR
jgi:hypothetical protein